MREEDQYQHEPGSGKQEKQKGENREKDQSAGEGGGAEPHSSEMNRQLKQFWDGTTRVGASLGTVFANMGDIFSGRDHVLMVRVNTTALDKVDSLVEAGMFKSRSESAAYLIAKGINADSALFEKIESKIGKINELRDELHDIISDNAGGEAT